MEKICFKCHATKPIAEFYAHPRMLDGHLGKCKDCTRRDSKEHRDSNLERVREYDRNRPNAPDRMKQNKKRAKENPDQSRRAKSSWIGRNQDKRAAQLKLGNAIQEGKIVRPNVCVKCGTEGKTEGHHPDYSKPLSVLWLCVPCHKAVHKEERAIRRAERSK